MKLVNLFWKQDSNVIITAQKNSLKGNCL